MKIEKIKESRINTVDFKNLDFGGVFTDHMYSCDFIDGKWINSEITPYKPITVSPASRARVQKGPLPIFKYSIS